MKTDHLRNNYLELGVAACKAGRLDQAAKMLEAGVTECERLNLKDLGTAALLYNLAVVYQKSGLSGQVERLLLRSLKLVRQYGQGYSPALYTVSRLLADYYFCKGNFEAAGYYYRQALKNPSLRLPDKMHYLMRLASIENAYARHARVQQICTKIYQLQKEHYPNSKDHPVIQKLQSATSFEATETFAADLSVSTTEAAKQASAQISVPQLSNNSTVFVA
jgi:tetratricopeptide (TPR) repeat protein